MGTGAISGSAPHAKGAASIFPVCVTAVALAALSPTFSMLARATQVVGSLSAVKLTPEALELGYTDEQLSEDVVECMAPGCDLSE